jgi:hypothetical protein
MGKERLNFHGVALDKSLSFNAKDSSEHQYLIGVICDEDLSVLLGILNLHPA